MKTREIKSLVTGEVIWSGEAETVKDAIHAAVAAGANLSGANLSRANLSWANLSGTDLSWANLSRANLSRANLSGANLSRANLSRANLSRANLSGTDLSWANLSGANLSRANLSGANLSRANLSWASVLAPTTNVTGETWVEYLTKVVPALLMVGGKTLESFAPHWACHTWDNCPMAFAFDVTRPEDVPPLLRPRSEQFVRLFDAKMIPFPLPTAAEIDASWKASETEWQTAWDAEHAKATPPVGTE